MNILLHFWTVELSYMGKKKQLMPAELNMKSVDFYYQEWMELEIEICYYHVE